MINMNKLLTTLLLFASLNGYSQSAYLSIDLESSLQQREWSFYVKDAKDKYITHVSLIAIGKDSIRLKVDDNFKKTLRTTEAFQIVGAVYYEMGKIDQSLKKSLTDKEAVAIAKKIKEKILMIIDRKN